MEFTGEIAVRLLLEMGLKWQSCTNGRQACECHLAELHACIVFYSLLAAEQSLFPLLCLVGARLITEIATLSEEMKARTLHVAHLVKYIH